MLSQVCVIVVESCSSEHRGIGSVSVSRGYVGFHAYLIKDAEFVVEVIILAAVLIVFFVHFFEGSQGIPVLLFVVRPIPLPGILEIFISVVVVLEVCLVIPSVIPILVSCSRIIPGPTTVPVCYLRGPYRFFMRARTLLGWLRGGLVRGLGQGLSQVELSGVVVKPLGQFRSW